MKGCTVDPGELLQYLIERAYEWIVSQHNFHFPAGRGILEPNIESLRSYFEPDIISSARIRSVDFIENPPFYSEVIKLGIPKFIDFRQMQGITFIDCILISNQFTHDQRSLTSLLFHEMVHVVQYSLLGARRFAELYVTGWAQNGFEYIKIPLEIQAYNLQRHFDQKEGPFSVTQLLNQEIEKTT